MPSGVVLAGKTSVVPCSLHTQAAMAPTAVGILGSSLRCETHSGNDSTWLPLWHGPQTPHCIGQNLPGPSPGCVELMLDVGRGGHRLASNLGFPFQILFRSFGEKLEVKPGRISHVIGGTVVIAVPCKRPKRHNVMGVALSGALFKGFLPKNPAAYGLVNHKNW